MPTGTRLRLEQRPPGPAVQNPDSPGWGRVGSSDSAAFLVPRSDGVAGNKLRHGDYRATLRESGGTILATSNVFTLTWHA